MQIGIQLYNFREELKQDFKGVLKEVAKMGYDAVEFFSFYNDLAPEEVSAMIRELGLVCCGTMFGAEKLKDKNSEVWAYNKILNSPAVTISAMGDFTEKWEAVRADCIAISRNAEEKGTHFSYHNHWAEYTLIDGMTAMERILEGPEAEKIMLEVDVCWLTRGKLDPASYIRKYASRIRQIHFKDIVVPEDPETTVPLGKGVIDLVKVYEAAKEINCPWLIYEQDTCTDPFACAEESLRFMRSLR